MSGLTVYKFGGSSLADAGRIRNAATLVRECPTPVVTVVSAMGGVTDLLVRAIAHADRGVTDHESLGTIGRRHREAAADFGLEPDTLVEPLLAELAELLGASATVRGTPPPIRDRIFATGEKLSARLLAAHLDRGEPNTNPFPAQAVDADTFLETDGTHGEAAPIVGIYPGSARAALRPLLDAGVSPIVTGFCGRAPCGSTTTLGRGGSDYSATLVAAALDATDVVIWTDVPGVYSAHPGIVPGASVVPQLNYREAGELAFYGAKVLHPRTIQPLIGPAIPVRIKSTFEPDADGTLIDATVTTGSHPVKAVSAVHGHALLSVEGAGMAGVPGIAKRIFGTLANAGISVTMISQSSAESSVCLAVPSHRATEAQVLLRDEFRLDLGRGDVEDIRVQTDAALVAVVGLGMNHALGIAARVFKAAARCGANILAIAQGASELNITFAVDEADSAKAIRALHDEFGLHLIDPGADNAAHADVLIVGYGSIGRALASLLEQRAPAITERFGLTPRVVGVSDRRGFLFDANGLSPERLADASELKSRGGSVADAEGGTVSSDAAEMIRTATGYRLANPIVVDVTDGDTRALHAEALTRGADVVTANKGPLAGPIAHYRELVEATERSGRFLRKEATVGAGLPIVDTIEHLVATGDRIRTIEGCLSGTLTYVLSRVGDGDDLARVLADAASNGYIEPNPLVDLSGEDVLRKAIIISRVAGLEIPDDKIACTGLVDRGRVDTSAPPPSPEEVIALCAGLSEMVESARKDGKVLRYVAQIEPGAITVGPRPVDPASPLGMLAGTDNLMLLRSDRYSDRPLVITGPGAGVDVTAMGVLTDILRIVAERTSR